MSVDYFEEQRGQMVAAIIAITDHVAAPISKSTLDKRIPGGNRQGPSARVCAGRGSAIRIQLLTAKRFRLFATWNPSES
jgi:hypothetical protein